MEYLVIGITATLTSAYLAWSFCFASSKPVPHMSDEEEDEGWVL